MAMTLVGLFLITSLPERLTNKGPMLWPVMGIVPSLILRTNDAYDWITEALIKSGCTFHFRGMWRGPLGITTADPSKIEYMLKSKELPKRRLLQRKTSDLLGEGIFNAGDDTWKQQRRAAISELHSGHFVAYSRQTVEDLVHQQLLKNNGKGKRWQSLKNPLSNTGVIIVETKGVCLPNALN